MKLSLVILLIGHLAVYGQSYSNQIEKDRAKKIEHFTKGPDAVLNEEDMAHYKGMEFFEIDTNYRIVAIFTKSTGKKFKMPTSTERTPIYRRYGFIEFTLNDTLCKLEVYQNMGLKKNKEYKDYLFIPFRDKTSGNTSYGGGRYLDVRIPQGERLPIDFNTCYNPYCAYSDRYSCPIPPEQNRIPVAISAGEKTPPGH